jgi:hypothetical protein
VCKPIVNRRYLQLVGKFCSIFVYLRERERESFVTNRQVLMGSQKLH